MLIGASLTVPAGAEGAPLVLRTVQSFSLSGSNFSGLAVNGTYAWVNSASAGGYGPHAYFVNAVNESTGVVDFSVPVTGEAQLASYRSDVVALINGSLFRMSNHSSVATPMQGHLPGDSAVFCASASNFWAVSSTTILRYPSVKAKPYAMTVTKPSSVQCGPRGLFFEMGSELYWIDNTGNEQSVAINYTVGNVVVAGQTIVLQGGDVGYGAQLLSLDNFSKGAIKNPSERDTTCDYINGSHLVSYGGGTYEMNPQYRSAVEEYVNPDNWYGSGTCAVAGTTVPVNSDYLQSYAADANGIWRLNGSVLSRLAVAPTLTTSSASTPVHALRWNSTAHCAVQKSSDGSSWARVVATSSGSASLATTKGTAAYVRVACPGDSPSNSELVTGVGFTTHTLSIRTRDGHPVGGEASWRMNGGKEASTSPVGFSSHGLVLPYTPGGVVTLSLGSVGLPSGAVASGVLRGLASARNSVVTLPSEPVPAVFTVRVRLANGRPAVGAHVSLTTLNCSVSVGAITFTEPTYSNVPTCQTLSNYPETDFGANGFTDAEGRLTVDAFPSLTTGATAYLDLNGERLRVSGFYKGGTLTLTLP